MKNSIIAQTSEQWFNENNLTYRELSNIGDAHILLKVIIEGLITDIEKYKKNPKQKEFYIQKQSKLISSLIQVLSVLKFYLYHDYLIAANEEIINKLGQDDVIDGVIIKFLFNKNNKHFAYSNIGVGI